MKKRSTVRLKSKTTSRNKQQSRFSTLKASVFVLIGLVSVIALLFNFSNRTDFTSNAEESEPKLRWSPPELVNPITIQLGTGNTLTTMDQTKDYIIKLPATKKIGYTWLNGGRNVVIIGGHVTTPSGLTGTSERRAFYIKDNQGIVHIEGVLIDSSGGGEQDAFAISAANSTVQLQNIRVENLMGTYNTEHADIIQPWGGVKELRVDRMTGSTNYQGFYFVQTQSYGIMDKIVVQNVNFLHQDNPSQNVPRMMYMVYDDCLWHPNSVSFTEVYFKANSQRPFEQTTYPSTTIPTACKASISSGTPRELTWPGQDWFTGSVKEGDPAGGDFVPAGTVGLGYVSPGYEGDVTPTDDPNEPTPSVTEISTPTSTPTPVPPTSTPVPTSTPIPTPAGDTTPPTVLITYPANSSFVSRNKSITIKANASDNVQVANVRFYVNNSTKCIDTTSPYTCNWKAPNTRNYNYEIRAVATDTANNTSSHAIMVTTK